MTTWSSLVRSTPIPHKEIHKTILADDFSEFFAPSTPLGYSQIHAIATLVIRKSCGSDLSEV